MQIPLGRHHGQGNAAASHMHDGATQISVRVRGYMSGNSLSVRVLERSQPKILSFDFESLTLNITAKVVGFELRITT